MSEDKKSLCKKISADNKQIITIYDTEGNEQDVTIQYDYYEVETYSDDENKGDKTTIKTDDTQADTIIPNAGKYTLFALIMSCVLTMVTFITLRNYTKNIDN